MAITCSNQLWITSLCEVSDGEEVLSRYEEAKILNISLACDSLWQGITDGEVLQTAISSILQIAGLSLDVAATTPICTWVVCSLVILTPVVLVELETSSLPLTLTDSAPEYGTTCCVITLEGSLVGILCLIMTKS